MTIRRGEIIGKRKGQQPKDVAEHFIQCPACDGWIDMRDLGQVFEHAGPLPHPGQDRTN
jgi:CRISPR/Cas system type I-B associated protein Csh2 (Cas7 group RAMP superfamily)